MSSDALFQLGMGSVLLKTSQEEETLRTHLSGAISGSFHRIALQPSMTVAALAGLVRADGRRRGNSARTLIPRAA